MEWVNVLLVDPITVEDGDVESPQRPGLGIELDERAVEEHAYAGAEDQIHTGNPFEEDRETPHLA